MARVSLFINRVQFLDQNWIDNAMNAENTIGGAHWPFALVFYGLILLLVGGLCYSLGVIFYLWKRLAYHHAVWHLFVMAGSLFHFFSILFYVLPPAD